MKKCVAYDNPQSEPMKFAAGRLESVLFRLDRPPLIEVYSRPRRMDNEKIEPQGYIIYKEGDRFIIEGADEAGAMYGGLDLADLLEAESLKWVESPKGIESLKGAESLKEADSLKGEGGLYMGLTKEVRAPRIAHRGIKLNIPLDARSPSYSDGGDSAQLNLAHMWDMEFWRGFLDRMALNKYNTLSLWSLSPFGSLVSTPGFEDAALEDVMQAAHWPRGTLRGWDFYTPIQAKSLYRIKKLTIEEKIKFWQDVMAYAKDRCIKIFLFIWNIYTYSTLHTQYNITDDPDNPVTRDYIRSSVEALIETYPLLAGIGVTAGENMRREWKTDVKEDILWVMDTYGRGIMSALKKQPKRDFTFIQRSHMCSPSQMEEVFLDFPHRLDFSFKYSQAHMYSAIKPSFGDDFFKEIKKGRRTWLTLRDDDFYMLRWGDFAFAKEYLDNIPGLVKGFYHGSDGIVRGRDYSCRLEEGDYFFDRHVLDFAIWGRLSYDMDLPVDYFKGLMERWFGKDGDVLYEALSHASRAIPILQQVYWNDYDFQWYPEACCGYNEEEDRLFFHDLNMFLSGSSCPGAGYLSIGEYCAGVKKGKIPPGVTPLEAAENIKRECHLAKDILDGITPSPGKGETLWMDIRDMVVLGLYYSAKIEASVYLGLWRALKEDSYKKMAILKAEEARDHWLAYSASMAVRYRPQRLSRLRSLVSPELFDSAAQVDIYIAKEG